jgi:hypothetical protein
MYCMWENNEEEEEEYGNIYRHNHTLCGSRKWVKRGGRRV